MGKPETYTTTENTYDKVWLDVRGQHDLTFSVRACREVIIIIIIIGLLR